MVVSSVDSPLP